MEQLFPVLKILIHQEYDELISSGPENRAVVENLTDKLACIPEIDVPLLMSVLVVNFLQGIAVKNGNGKIHVILFVHTVLEPHQILVIRAFVADRGKRIDKCFFIEILNLVILLDDHLFCSEHVDDQIGNYKQDNGNDRKDDENVILNDVDQTVLNVFSGIVGQSGMND